MRIKTAVTLFCFIILAIFSVLAVSLIRTTDLLDYEASELAKAGESISVAKLIKVRLLLHNRNVFLHQLKKETLVEASQVQFQEINKHLMSMDLLLNNKEEAEVLSEVKDELSQYFSKRGELDREGLSAIEKYINVSQDVDQALASIDKLIAVNQTQMNELVSSIHLRNRNANRTALAVFVIGGLLLVLIVAFIFKFVLRPLLEISKVIAEYGTKDKGNRIKLNGVKEIREIGANFNLMAEQLEERRQDQLRFLSSIAHDLRNPLSAMSLTSQMIIMKGKAEELKFAKLISNQVKNLDRLVGDLLDTTRIEAGHLELNYSDNDVRQIIQEAVELHQSSSQLHQIRTELPQEPIFCHCDRDRLTQVLNNLISNAIKYSPNGGTITIKNWSDERGVNITVSDEGIGIEADEIENIFKPFQRSKATKGTIPGIGLGLSSSRKIIQAHHGTLIAVGGCDQGSTFQIYLPIESGMVQQDVSPRFQVGTDL